MKNNFMIALYSLIKTEYLHSFILWTTQNSSCPRVNVYLTAQFTLSGAEEKTPVDAFDQPSPSLIILQIPSPRPLVSHEASTF